ncbi:NADPH-dependent oxidoreductase 2-alkenal reductase like protein [Verticillium longisporum]|nr:NADPH-dependent oxidoreductase 2-alkenal reductase like protein [Verticillium longisporum]
MPGTTAYEGLYEIGKPVAGETIFVSSAAGAVGQLVGQLAKAEGLKVIGSAGSQEKIDFIINELGFDGAFNYKTDEPNEALARLAPSGIDIYWDNVGGAQLEAALHAINKHGRIIACGSIVDYNVKPEDRYGVKNLFNIIGKSLTFKGFIVSLTPERYQAFNDKVQPLLADGKVKAKVDITEGIENAPEGLVGIFHGKNFGKAVLKVKA